MTSRVLHRSWAFSLALGLLPLNGAYAQTSGKVAPPSPEFVAWEAAQAQAATSLPNAPKALYSLQPGTAAHNFGYRPSPVSLSYIQRTSLAQGTLSNQADLSPLNGITFPASYDLRTLGKLTPVRDQGYFGTCWAHGAMGSLESTQLKEGKGSFDLSEWHLAWYNYNDFNANLVSFTKRTLPAGKDTTFDQGGNAYQAIALLGRGTGAVNESDAPYHPVSYVNPDDLPKGTESVSVQLQEGLFCGNAAAIKSALMNYGSVSFAFYWDDGNFNAAPNAYRLHDPYDDWGSNHIVDIVGWNDNYPAANFPAGNRPTYNGAWIVRNSWGSGWGDNGYFYLSYDSTIYEPYVFISGPATDTDIYQYDPLGWEGNWGTGSDTAMFSNIFTAHATENIDSVAFYAATTNSVYTISVRSNVTGDPSTGTLVSSCTTTGTLGSAGYRRVSLASPLPVAAGTQFAIIVKLKTPGYYYPTPIECPYLDGTYSSKATANPGESFVADDPTAPVWYDLTTQTANQLDMKNANVCLKAFSSSLPITATPVVTTGKAGSTASVTAGTNYTYTWGITGGTITAGAGTHAITYTAGPVGTVHLTCKVKNAAGTTGTGSTDVTVAPAPVAVITVSSPIITTLTSGHTAFVAAGPAGTTYTWSSANATITSATDGPSITYTAGSVGSAILKCVVDNGYGASVVGTKTVSVIAAPVTTITAAANATTGKTALVASVPLQTGCTYAWSLTGNGTITSVTNHNSITYTAGAVGSLKLDCQVTNAAGTSGTGTKSVAVVPVPVATITADSYVATGKSNLPASVPPDQLGCTYAWTATGGTITPPTNTASVTYKAGVAGTMTLKCVVTNAAGAAITGTKSVTVAASVATIKAVSPVTTGVVAGYTALVPATPGATFDWSGSTEVTSTDYTTNPLIYTPGSVGTATLKCAVTVGGVTTPIIPKAITVIAAPVTPTIAAAIAVTTLKTGLTAHVVTPQPGCTFTWSIPAGEGTITAGATTSAITYTAGAAGITLHLNCTAKNAAGTTATTSQPVPVVPLPVATITAISPVTSGVAGWTASATFNFSYSYSWSITGGTINGSTTGQSISYTPGPVGTTTLKCIVANLAGTPVTCTKAISVIAKPSATITAPATATVEAVYMASVPAQTGCSYAWSVISGTADILGGAGTHSITYKTSETTADPFTLQCIVTNAAGNSATGTKIVSVTFRNVTGTSVVTHLSLNSATGVITPTSVPFPYSNFSAILSDGTILPGALNAAGRFTIPNVPGGFYWLRHSDHPNDYVWTNLTNVSWNYPQYGRTTTTYPSSATNVVFGTTGLNPWQSNDYLVFYDFNTNCYSNPDLDSFAGQPNPGDTSLNALTVDWHSNPEGTLPLVNTTKGDAPRLVQMVTSTNGSENLQIAKKIYKPASLAMLSGTGATIGGTFSTPATADVVVNYNRSEFAAYRAQYNPGRTLKAPFIEFDALPGATKYGLQGNSLDNLFCQNSDKNVVSDLNLGNVAVPTLPLGFQRIVYAGENHFVYPQIGGATPWSFKGRIRTFSTTLPTVTTPLQPMISPVKSPTINGNSLFSDQAGVSETPTLAWTAPDLGTPQGYMVYIYHLTVGNGVTTGSRVACLYIPGDVTSVTMPAGILEVGETYCLQIRAFADSTYNPAAAPYLGWHFPYGFADSLSNPFTTR